MSDISSREYLSEFEKADELLKQAISDYQLGTIQREALVMKLKELTPTFGDTFKVLGVVGDGLRHRLKQALEEISKGNDNFITIDSSSYHKIVWEAHRLLIKVAKEKSLKHFGNSLVGWSNYKEVPPEVRKFSKFFPSSAVFLRTDVGWVAYISPGAGGKEDHFTIVKRINNTLEASLSDFMSTRTEALKDVLQSVGFKQIGMKRIAMGKIAEEDYYNYILDIEGDCRMIDCLIQVLFRSQHMAFLSVRSQTKEEAKKREIMILKHLLQAYLEHPDLPYVPWGDIICDSDLQEVLGRAPYNDVLKLIDELLKLSPKELNKVIRTKYHYPDFMKHYATKEDLLKAGVAGTIEEAEKIWSRYEKRRKKLIERPSM